MDKPTARISIYVLPVIGILVVTSVDLANGMSCSNNSLAAALGRQTKQMDAGTATLNKLEGQFDKLCQYGRKSGTPLFERQIKELSDIVKTCQDMITRAVLFSNRVTFIGYKAGVEADCKRADALSRTPQSVEDFLARGKAFSEKKSYDRAIADFGEAIRLDPRTAAAFYHRARAFSDSKKDIKAAVSDIVEAVRLDPQFGGNDYFAGGEDDKIVSESFTLANDTVTTYPDFSSAYTARSLYEYYRGDIDLTIRDAAKAISLYANDTGAMNNRALAYIKKGDLPSAIGDLEEAILLKPKSAGLYRNRGYAYLQSGDLEHALSDLNEAIRLDPNQQPAFAYRGQVHEKMGQRDTAIADYRAAVFMDVEDYHNVGLAAYLIAGRRLGELSGGPKAAQ